MTPRFQITEAPTPGERAFDALLWVLGGLSVAGTVFGIVMLAFLGMAA